MENKETKSPSMSAVQMEELVLPNDANGLNNLFGGRLLQWIDIAGAMAAMKHSRKEVVTVAIDSVDFREPVRVGDMVKLIAKVTWTGRTSMEVKVNVIREKPRTGETIKTNKAFITMVALDDNGNPTDVPQLKPETDEERKDYNEAVERRNNRLNKKP
jgi:acyl-CoA hydrolase